MEGRALGKLLHALLREAGANGRTLASLELRVALADDIHRSFAFHDLAIGVTALGGSEGRKNFHDWKLVGDGVVGTTGARKLAARPRM